MKRRKWFVSPSLVYLVIVGYVLLLLGAPQVTVIVSVLLEHLSCLSGRKVAPIQILSVSAISQQILRQSCCRNVHMCVCRI